MRKNSVIIRHTIDELNAFRRTDGSRSDFARAASLTENEIEAALASDLDEAGMVVDWSRAEVALPVAKAVLHMRVDKEVLDFFRTGGRGYQTKINAVLKAYMQAHAPK